ncbi:MAG: WD40 repeat domain-containing protein, partial [Planctomycetaceae bacterium]
CEATTGRTLIERFSPKPENVVAPVGFLDEQSAISVQPIEHGCSVDVWDIPTGRIRQSFHHYSVVLTVAVSRDEKTLATSDSGAAIQLWDVATGKLQATLMGQRNPAHRLAFSPDGRTLASATGAGDIKLWRLPIGQSLFDLHGAAGDIQLLTFSSDGRRLLYAAGGQDIIVWGVSPGQSI